MWGLEVLTFRGKIFLCLRNRDSYVWRLVYLRLGVKDAYVWGLVIIMFGR